VKYRRKEQGRFFGGPMDYMERGLKNNPMARAFALMCAVSAVTACNITQTNSVSTAMLSEFGVPLWVSGAAVTLCVALVTVGGIKRIGRVTELVIPFISVTYICVSLAFLHINREQVPGALGLIVKEAFGIKPLAGGVAGYGISRAMRFGLARGVFTNEAGLGSAPIAHAGADCKSPAHQAVWGIFEVFLDTIVVCTLTALVLLTAGGGRLWQAGQDGAPLTAAAFSSVFGSFGGRFIALSILFFAVSAVLGWYYYGEVALRYLWGRSERAVRIYRALFLAFAFLGAVMEMSLVWGLTDILIALMAIPNVAALLLLRGEVEYGG
jgi:AGCS family alanine or glycine:cation symporter